MGMFDTISISDALPFTQEMIDLGLDVNNHNWQTKDLDNAMALYFIQGGELFVEKYKKQTWIEGNKNSESFMDKIGYLHREDPYLEKVDIHGEVFFYDHVNDVQGKWDCWIEFKAIFTHGKIEKIELFKFSKKDNAERKALDKEFVQRQMNLQNAWYNKYFLCTRPMIWFRRNIWFRFWDELETAIGKIKFFI